jgi:hypothetical protein
MSKPIPKGLAARVAIIAALAIWLALWLIPSRYAMLDDCFIHLRYADFLVKTHTITYDGIHRSFGTSSPLYVAVLALLRPVFSGPLLPKGLSVALYLALIALLLTLCILPARSSLARALLCLLTFCLICPMGIRWLTDGMETSFQILFIVLLALITDAEMHASIRSIPRIIGLIAFGFLLTTLRIEGFSLIFLAALTIYLTQADRYPTASRLRLALQAVPLAAGSVLALLTIRLTLGNFLPDTAVAKSGAASLKPLLELNHLILSSLTLGIGVLLVWIVSLILIVRSTIEARHQARRLRAVAAANAIFPLIAILACLRGQMMQGIRYVLWCMVFSTMWNVLQLSRMSAEPRDSALRRSLPFPLRQPYGALSVLALLLVLLLPVEAYWVYPALVGRGITFTQMSSAPLARLHSDRIVAGDVGYIGYFSHGNICDVEGLVDGRAFAAQTPLQRAQACATQSPDVLFLSDAQLAQAAPFTNLDQWSVCRTFDFTRVTVMDRHYLMVPRTLAATKCPNLGGAPTPYPRPSQAQLAALIPHPN